MIHKGSFYFKTKTPMLHFWRAVIGSIAIGAVTYSVINVPLLKNTCILFTEPIIVLILAAILLKERISRQCWIRTCIGFCGVVIITYKDFALCNWWILAPIVSAISFAVITILAQRLAADEPIITSLFYFGVGTALIFLGPAMFLWRPLNARDAAAILALGINGNLMQICMFGAFRRVAAAQLMPYRYTEMLFTMAAGAWTFGQHPPMITVVGAVIIIVMVSTSPTDTNRYRSERPGANHTL
jgi:drug/metabolite transporter (DMT)-like permease